jgi:hypothetical protein
MGLTALLGEADLLSGQMLCPRSPPNSLAAFTDIHVSKEEWVVQGICAYVPQVRRLLAFLSFFVGISFGAYRLRG